MNLIVGPTGSGKTSLLMALLGEMHYIPSGPDSFVSLPREGGVAYAAQESWVQNDTIKVCTLRNSHSGAINHDGPYRTTSCLGRRTMRPGTRKVKDKAAMYRDSAHAFDVVLKQCALERDLSLFDAGDLTEVGEKGVTLR